MSCALSRTRVPVLRDPGVARGHAALQPDCAIHRVHHAGKLGQNAVTHQLDDAAVVPGNLRVDELSMVGLERSQGRLLVRLHEAAVADHVGRENRGQLGFHPVPCSHSRVPDTDRIIHQNPPNAMVMFGHAPVTRRARAR